MSNQVPVPQSYIDSITSDFSSLSEPIRDALLSVRRHRFLDGWFLLELDNGNLNYQPVDFDRDAPSHEGLSVVYSDRALVTVHDGIFPTSSASQPSLVARMLQLLEIVPGMRTLEIGTGTGYNAALLAEIGGERSRIFTIEYQQSVAEKAHRFLQEEGYDKVRVVHGDGFQGIKEGKPFDRIVATVGCSDISPHWLEQLSPEGVMLIPIQHGLTHPLVHLTRNPEDPLSAVGRIVERSIFMKIQGILDLDSPWMSHQIPGFQEDPAWCHSFPEGLVIPETCKHPLDAAIHRSFYLFLALCSRELWYDNFGYGLVDPESKSIVKFTNHGVEGLSVGKNPTALEQLYKRLLSLHRTWTSLGSPEPSDYTLCFTPKTRTNVAPSNPLREWHIERPYFLETIRLT